MAKNILHKNSSNEGFALLLVIFIISLATIIVTAFSTETFAYIKRNRASSDMISADYAAHSALEIALSILEIPDDPAKPQQAWQLLNSASVLPLDGFTGEVRVQIIDQDSLINVNAISSPYQQNPLGQNPLGQNPLGQNPTSGDSGEQDSSMNIHDFWKFTLVNLFNDLSYTSFGPGGSSAAPYTTEQQVAIVADWIDPDTLPFTSPNFPAQGNEFNSSDGNMQSLNRALRTIDELGTVHGISKSFLQMVAPYLRATTPTDYKINVNTAHPLVLKALGFQDTEINGIIDKRQIQQLTPQELEVLVPPSSSIAKAVTTTSNNYKVLVRSKTVSSLRWLEADCIVQSGFGKKIATVRTSRVL